MMTPERIAYLAQTMWNATVDAGHVAQSPTDPEKGARMIPWNALKDGAKAAIIAGTEVLVEILAVESPVDEEWALLPEEFVKDVNGTVDVIVKEKRLSFIPDPTYYITYSQYTELPFLLHYAYGPSAFRTTIKYDDSIVKMDGSIFKKCSSLEGAKHEIKSRHRDLLDFNNHK